MGPLGMCRPRGLARSSDCLAPSEGRLSAGARCTERGCNHPLLLQRSPLLK